jgi:hypothetical protein
MDLDLGRATTHPSRSYARFTSMAWSSSVIVGAMAAASVGRVHPVVEGIAELLRNPKIEVVSLMQLRELGFDIDRSAVVGAERSVQFVSDRATKLYILQSLNARILVAKHSTKSADDVRRRCRPLPFCLFL